MNINPITSLTPEIIARAWRSPEFAATLPAELQKQLPANPAGEAVASLTQDTQESRHHHTRHCGTAMCYSHVCNTHYVSCR